jgi:hypothetical protein
MSAGVREGNMASKMRDILAAILILAIVILALIGIFRPGPTGEWAIKWDGLEAKGSDVALAFAVLLAGVVLLHPGLRKALKSVARSVLKSFMEAFWHRWTLIVLLVYLAVATSTYLLWPLDRQRSDRTPLYYLLSTQAQVLSAIVALVFTTTIVVAQLVSRYSQRILHQVLGSWVLWYLSLYLIGIICPLFLLNKDFPLWTAQISLLIGGFCLVLLIPYYITLRDHLAPDTAIRNMVPERLRKGRQDFRSGRRSGHDIFNYVYNLQNFAMGAYGSYDQETFEQTLKALRKVGSALITKVAKEQDASARELLEKKLKNLLCYRLGYMARWTLGHPRAPFVVIERLRDLGIKAVKTGQGSLAREFIKALLKVGSDALHRDIPDAACYAVGAVGRVVTRAVERQLWEVVRYEEVAWILKIGQTAAQKSMDEVVRRVSTVLWRVATTAIDVASSHTGDKTRKRAQRVARSFSEAMGEVGRVALETVSDEVALEIVSHLGYRKKSRGEPTDIGGKAIQAGLGYVLRGVIGSLGKVYGAALTKGRHKVAHIAMWAFTNSINSIKEAGSMDQEAREHVSAVISSLEEATRRIVENWNNVNDEIHMRRGASTAEGWGFVAQDAINIGNYDDFRRCIDGLEALVEKVEKLGLSKLPTKCWRAEEGICWYLAVSLCFVLEYAFRAGLGEEAKRIINIIMKINEAARQLQGTTDTLVELANRFARALTIYTRAAQRE